MSKQYPRGKLRADDDGQLCIAMAVKDQTIIIDFGKPVAWLGFGLAEAETLIRMLQSKVDELKGRAT